MLDDIKETVINHVRKMGLAGERQILLCKSTMDNHMYVRDTIMSLEWLRNNYSTDTRCCEVCDYKFKCFTI